MVEQEPGHRPLAAVVNGFWEYMASGPGEEIDAALYDWAWNDPGSYRSNAWVAGRVTHSREHLSGRKQGALR